MSRQPLALLTAPILAFALAACASTTPAAEEADGGDAATAPPAAGGDTGRQPAPGNGPANAACKPEAAQSFVGQPGSDALAEQARAAAGASAVRMLKPGQPMTMDYRSDRLNVMLDDAGLVAEVRCG